MNAHNEQHDPASAVVKQNLTTAAAQEAVAWQRRYIGATRGNRPVEWHTITKDEFEATKAGKWADRYEVRALYAAPVTAAPAEPDLDAHDPASGELAAQWLYRNGFKELAYVIRTQLDMRGGRIRELSASTPAAPGIDLAALRARVVSAIERITSGTGQMRVPADLTDPDLVLADVLTLLDALDPHCTDSPKGGSALAREMGVPVMEIEDERS